MCFVLTLPGLRLTLNIHSSDYIGMFSPTVGARIAIHSHQVEPFPEDDGISAAPGMETSIGARMVRVLVIGHLFFRSCS